MENVSTLRLKFNYIISFLNFHTFVNVYSRRVQPFWRYIPDTVISDKFDLKIEGRRRHDDLAEAQWSNDICTRASEMTLLRSAVWETI